MQLFSSSRISSFAACVSSLDTAILATSALAGCTMPTNVPMFVPLAAKIPTIAYLIQSGIFSPFFVSATRLYLALPPAMSCFSIM